MPDDSTDATTAATPATATPPATAAPTKDQVRHVADAVIAEAVRKLGKALKPADAALLDGIAIRATKLAIDERAVDATDAKAVKAIARRKAQLTAQLASVRSFGTDQASGAFWAALERVVDRLTQFAVGAAVAAVV